MHELISKNEPLRIPFFLRTWLIGCLVLASSSWAVDYTITATGGGTSSWSGVMAVLACGDTVTVEPGYYDTSVRVPDLECTASNPVVIRAENPVVEAWDDKVAGAGALNKACESDDEIDYHCDYDVISYVYRIFGRTDKSASYLTIAGFETNYIDFSGDPDRGTVGCENCRIERNFANVNFKRCMNFSYSDGIEIVGNRLFRCGGSGSGSVDLTGMASVGMEIHHNDLYGSGEPNTMPPEEGEEGYCEDWRDCKQYYHGTDGYTASNKDECGTKFHHNRVYRHATIASNPNDDGDGLDLKRLDCSHDPVLVFENEFFENQGSKQVTFHLSARGIRFYNNLVEGGTGSGITLQSGQECYLPAMVGLSDIRIFGNIISENGNHGIYNHLGSGPCYEGGIFEYPDAHNIRIFNNLIKDNTGYGIRVRWVTDDGVSRDSGLALDAQAWLIASNILEGNAYDAGAGENYQLALYDDYSDDTSGAIRLEDFVTIDRNLIDGPSLLEVDQADLGLPDEVHQLDPSDLDAYFGGENFAGLPTYVDEAGGNYRLDPSSLGVDMALDFADSVPPGELAGLPIMDFDEAPRPERSLNDIGPFETCADTDGDGLGDCVDPEPLAPNTWFWVNPDSSTLPHLGPGATFVMGAPATPTTWRGTTPLYTEGVAVGGVVDESKAGATVYLDCAGSLSTHGICIEPS